MRRSWRQDEKGHEGDQFPNMRHGGPLPDCVHAAKPQPHLYDLHKIGDTPEPSGLIALEVSKACPKSRA